MERHHDHICLLSGSGHVCTDMACVPKGGPRALALCPKAFRKSQRVGKKSERIITASYESGSSRLLLVHASPGMLDTNPIKRCYCLFKPLDAVIHGVVIGQRHNREAGRRQNRRHLGRWRSEHITLVGLGLAGVRQRAFQITEHHIGLTKNRPDQCERVIISLTP